MTQQSHEFATARATQGHTRQQPLGLAVALAVVALVVAACTYRPGADNPVAVRLTWFSYAEAADIRDACRPGAADRFRVIYNGHYDEQVRSYDVTALADGAMVETRVRGDGNLTRGIMLGDPFGPWRAEGRLVRIGIPELDALRRALGDSGLTRPPSAPLRLDSTEFYWLVNACLDGRFVVNAWKFPTARFAALGFPVVLMGHDPTGIELNPPRPANQFPERKYERVGDDAFQFLLEGNRLNTGGAAFGG